MIDEYGHYGHVSYGVPLKRGEEKKTIVVCADDSISAERLALMVAEDEDHVIWDCEEGEIQLDGLPDKIDVECDTRFAWMSMNDEPDRV